MFDSLTKCQVVAFRRKTFDTHQVLPKEVYLAGCLTGFGCKESGDFSNGISGAAITGRYNYFTGVMEHDTRFNPKPKHIENRKLNK